MNAIIIIIIILAVVYYIYLQENERTKNNPPKDPGKPIVNQNPNQQNPNQQLPSQLNWVPFTASTDRSKVVQCRADILDDATHNQIEDIVGKFDNSNPNAPVCIVSYNGKTFPSPNFEVVLSN